MTALYSSSSVHSRLVMPASIAGVAFVVRGYRLWNQLGIDDTRNRPQSVLKLQTDQSRRLELDDSAIRIAGNQLTQEVPQKRKVPDNHQPVIRGSQ
jgi:hypothetical protein